MDNITQTNLIRRKFNSKHFDIAVFWNCCPYNRDQLAERTKKNEITSWRMLGVFFYVANNIKTQKVVEQFGFKSHASISHSLKVVHDNLKSKTPNFIKLIANRLDECLCSLDKKPNVPPIEEIQGFVSKYFEKSHYQHQLSNSIFALMNLAVDFPINDFPENQVGLKTVYISGRISGMEKAAFGLFEEAEFKLLEKGYRVVNPMKLPHRHDLTWESYMKEDIAALCACDYIYFLSNWMDSRGAQIENMIADLFNIPTLNL